MKIKVYECREESGAYRRNRLWRLGDQIEVPFDETLEGDDAKAQEEAILVDLGSAFTCVRVKDEGEIDAEDDLKQAAELRAQNADLKARLEHLEALVLDRQRVAPAPEAPAEAPKKRGPGRPPKIKPDDEPATE